MGKTISICNQKGGTGKTTTTVNLAAALALSGKKILIIDIDPQGNATSGVGINKSEIQASIYEVLLNKISPPEAVISSAVTNLDVIPCNINLTGAEIELVGVMSRETRLKKAISVIQNNYDYIFIDSPPSLGLLTLNALVACESIIIPIQCEFYALEGVTQLLKTINLVRDGLNPSLRIEGVLLTMADFRTNLTNEVINEIKSFFKEKVFDTVIPRNIKLSEAPSYGKPISLYDNSSIGAKKYNELAEEFLKRHEHKSFNINRIHNIENSENTQRTEKIAQEDANIENSI